MTDDRTPAASAQEAASGCANMILIIIAIVALLTVVPALAADALNLHELAEQSRIEQQGEQP